MNKKLVLLASLTLASMSNQVTATEAVEGSETKLTQLIEDNKLKLAIKLASLNPGAERQKALEGMRASTARHVANLEMEYNSVKDSPYQDPEYVEGVKFNYELLKALQVFLEEESFGTE